MKIEIRNSANDVLAFVEDKEEAAIIYNNEYVKDDKIIFESKKGQFVKIKIDSKIVESIIYLPQGKMSYTIPFGIARKAYDAKTFEGEYHEIHMSEVKREDTFIRRNLALNGLDLRGEINYFPHSDANIVTRDEPWFESRNAIDGYKETEGHGPFPYQSWGGGLRDDLEYRLHFGREVLVDEVVLYLRADYYEDHDINWETGVMEFSDGSKIPISMSKTTEGQSFSFEPKKVKWIKLNHLRREISKAFSALIEIEVYGRDVRR